MGVFRRARGLCRCGHELIGQVVGRATRWSGRCPHCGAEVSLPADKTWWISYRDQTGRHHKRQVGTLRKAQHELLQVMAEVRAGTHDARRRGREVPDLQGLLGAYLEHVAPRRKRYALSRERSCTKHLAEVLGPRARLAAITERELERYRETRAAAEAASGTITRELIVLSAALSWAVERGWLRSRPTIHRSGPEAVLERFLSHAEARRLAWAADQVAPYLGRLVRVALATGMRRGELLQMTPGWVDLEARMIRIPSAAAKSRRQRYVPISDELAELLRAPADSTPGPGNVAAGAGPRAAVVCPCPHLPQLRDHFMLAAKAAGLGPCRFHDLRHTFASWLVQAGVDLYRVARILGHQDLATTQRYAHLAPEHLHEAVRAAQLEHDSDPQEIPGGLRKVGR